MSIRQVSRNRSRSNPRRDALEKRKQRNIRRTNMHNNYNIQNKEKKEKPTIIILYER